MESKLKPPAFQFYAGDFLSDLRVTIMSMEERGVYITLLAYSWLEDGLPDDETVLAQLCNNPKNWDRIWERVKECFTIKEGNVINNRRLVRERAKLMNYKKSMSDAGKKGAKTRWGGNNQAIAKLKPSHSSSSEVEDEDTDEDKELWNGFWKFWELYPKKQAKQTTIKAYMKLFKDNKKITHEELINAVKKQSKSKQWLKDGGEFIPLPSTWLNQERWLDEVTEYTKPMITQYKKAKSGIYLAYCSLTGDCLMFDSLNDIKKANFTSPAGGDLLAQKPTARRETKANQDSESAKASRSEGEAISSEEAKHVFDMLGKIGR